MSKSKRIFSRTDHWVSGEGCVARYVVLCDVATGTFGVQSKDYFHLPLADTDLRMFERQFLELLAETALADRCDWHGSAIQAIEAFDREFA